MIKFLNTAPQFAWRPVEKDLIKWSHFGVLVCTGGSPNSLNCTNWAHGHEFVLTKPNLLIVKEAVVCMAHFSHNCTCITRLNHTVLFSSFLPTLKLLPFICRSNDSAVVTGIYQLQASRPDGQPNSLPFVMWCDEVRLSSRRWSINSFPSVSLQAALKPR